MIALRQLQPIQGNRLTIHLPVEFSQYQQAEIIILPVEETRPVTTSTAAFLQRFAGAIPDFPEVESIGNLQECEELL